MNSPVHPPSNPVMALFQPNRINHTGNQSIHRTPIKRTPFHPQMPSLRLVFFIETMGRIPNLDVLPKPNSKRISSIKLDKLQEKTLFLSIPTHGWPLEKFGNPPCWPHSINGSNNFPPGIRLICKPPQLFCEEGYIHFWTTIDQLKLFWKGWDWDPVLLKRNSGWTTHLYDSLLFQGTILNLHTAATLKGAICSSDAHPRLLITTVCIPSVATRTTVIFVQIHILHERGKFFWEWQNHFVRICFSPWFQKQNSNISYNS